MVAITLYETDTEIGDGEERLVASTCFSICKNQGQMREGPYAIL